MTRATTHTGTAAISVQSGGVNEAAVSKLLKILGPNNSGLVQMASATLGCATNKLAGEGALVGATLAQWGTKWNELDQYLGNSEKKNDRETGALVELAKKFTAICLTMKRENFQLI